MWQSIALLMSLLTIFAQISLARSTSYRSLENSTTLTVEFDEENFLFTSDNTLLLSIRVDEVDNFLQVARDLEDFDQRVGKSIQALKIFSSVALSIASGGIAVGGKFVTVLTRFLISTTPFYFPDYKGDIHVHKTGRNDLPYLFNPTHYSRWSLPKDDLEATITALGVIKNEYDNRLARLSMKKASLLSPESKNLSCKPNGRVSLQTIHTDILPIDLSVDVDETLASTTWYNIFINHEDTHDFFRRYFPVFSIPEDRPIARIEIHNERLSLLAIEITRSMDFNSYKYLGLHEILATLGDRTKYVNTHYIANQPREINLVHTLGLSVAECLRRDEELPGSKPYDVALPL